MLLPIMITTSTLALAVSVLTWPLPPWNPIIPITFRFLKLVTNVPTVRSIFSITSSQLHSPFLNSSTALCYQKIKSKFLIQFQPTYQLYILPHPGFANFYHLSRIRFFLFLDFTHLLPYLYGSVHVILSAWHKLLLFFAYQTHPSR